MAERFVRAALSACGAGLDKTQIHAMALIAFNDYPDTTKISSSFVVTFCHVFRCHLSDS